MNSQSNRSRITRRKIKLRSRGRVLEQKLHPVRAPCPPDRAAGGPSWRMEQELEDGAGGWSWSRRMEQPLFRGFAAGLRVNSSPSAHPFSSQGRCFSVGTLCPRAMPPSPAGARPGGRFLPVPPVPTRFLPGQAQGALILLRCFLSRQHLFPVPNATGPGCWAAVTSLSPQEDEPVPCCCPCPAGARLSLSPGVPHPFPGLCIPLPGALGPSPGALVQPQAQETRGRRFWQLAKPLNPPCGGEGPERGLGAARGEAPDTPGRGAGQGWGLWGRSGSQMGIFRCSLSS